MTTFLMQYIDLDQPDLVSGDYRVSYSTVRAYRRGEALNLRPKEFLIFEMLLRYRSQVVARDFLSKYIGINDCAYERTLDVHMMRLRKNLRLRRWRNPITTVREAGYRLD
jgi:DNA-binding response OmpR family regulator